jgi:peptidyl-Lys metalloendopeptidase
MFSLLLTGASAAFVSTIRPLTSSGQVNFEQDQFLFEYEITNQGPEDRFLPWKTPLDGLWEDLFLIQDQDGHAVPYSGKIARRLPHTDEDFIVMQEGETLRAKVDLTRAYDLDHDGYYTVSLRQLDQVEAPQYEEQPTTTIVAKATHLQQAAWEAAETEMLGTDWGQCTNSQQTTIRNGLNLALGTQVPRARACMTGSSPSCNQWNTWFGAFQATRYSTVQRCWQNIQNDLPNANFNCCVGCGGNCGPNLFAYVFPNDRTMTQFMCAAFFSMPNEQAETLTHEQSHFTRTCGTVDHTYGETSSRSLALTNPQMAIENADNHAFFGRWA